MTNCVINLFTYRGTASYDYVERNARPDHLEYILSIPEVDCAGFEAKAHFPNEL